MGITCAIGPFTSSFLTTAKRGLPAERSRWKDRHPLVWDSSAAGHVDAGEEYDDAAAGSYGRN